MGLYTTPPSYSGNSAAPWVQGIGSLGQAFLRAPAMQAMARQREQMAQLEAARMAEVQARVPLVQAQTDEAKARTLETGRKADRAQLQLDSAKKLSDIFMQPGAVTQDAAGNYVFSKGAMEAAVPMIAGMGTSATDSSSGLANIFKSGNAVTQADQNRKKPVSVSPGAAMVGPDGKVIYQNPSAAAQAANEETTTTNYPKVDPEPAISATHTGGFFGLGGTDVPGKPAVVGQPARKVTTKRTLPASGTPASGLAAAVSRPLGAAATPGNQPATPDAPGTGQSSGRGEQMMAKTTVSHMDEDGNVSQVPVPSAAPAGKVRVQHPNGQYGYIPAEQLQDALDQKYKLAQ